MKEEHNFQKTKILESLMEKHPLGVPTGQFAEIVGVKHQSILSSFCKKGHYLGITPNTQPNGRHLWPLDFLI